MIEIVHIVLRNRVIERYDDFPIILTAYALTTQSRHVESTVGTVQSTHNIWRVDMTAVASRQGGGVSQGSLRFYVDNMTVATRHVDSDDWTR